MSTVSILGIAVSLIGKDIILEKIEKYIIKLKVKSEKLKVEKQKALTIFTPNPEIVVYANKHQYFKEIVNTGQINIFDGMGVVAAARLIGYPIVNRVAGVDLLEDIAQIAYENTVKIGLIGGKPGVALKTLECLQARYPGLKGLAEEGPTIKLKVKSEKLKVEETVLDYGGWSVEKFVERMKREKVGVLFVGFGYPKQELFIHELSKRLTNTILMAVGGSFDYISGSVSRAPVVMRRLGLEWLYRLFRQPWRIKRQMALVQFVWLIIYEKFKKSIKII